MFYRLSKFKNINFIAYKIYKVKQHSATTDAIKENYSFVSSSNLSTILEASIENREV